MITTTCKALNWAIDKATEYDKSAEHTCYRFRGNVAYRMVTEIMDWAKANNGNYTDGRSRTSYNVNIEDRLDVTTRQYNHTSINVSRGNSKGTSTDLEVMITVYDCIVSEADLTDMVK